MIGNILATNNRSHKLNILIMIVNVKTYLISHDIILTDLENFVKIS